MHMLHVWMQRRWHGAQSTYDQQTKHRFDETVVIKQLQRTWHLRRGDNRNRLITATGTIARKSAIFTKLNLAIHGS
jgi:hypothetical protein